MTLAWIEAQIQDALNSPDSPQNVRDYALLCIARENLKAELAGRQKSNRPPQTARAVSPVDLTLDSVQQAIGNLSVTTPQQLKRARDAKTWVGIMRG